MATVNWTRPALEDLAAVAEFVAASSRENSVAIVRSAFLRADERQDFPDAGAIVPEMNNPALREVIVKDSFRLIYERIGQQVFILAFIHSSRQIGSEFLNLRRENAE